METPAKNKNVILFTALLALISLVVLGSAMKDVSFQTPRPLSQSDSETMSVNVGEVVKQIGDVPFWKQAVFWTLIFFLVLMLSSLLSPEARKRVLIGLIRIALFAIFFMYLTQNNPGFLEGLFQQNTAGANTAATPAPAADLPPPVFEPPQISSWLSFVVTLILILVAGSFAWRVDRWWKRRSELQARNPLDEIAEIARTSLQALSLDDSSPHDTIIKCYERMSQVVDTRRGLYREDAMTPAEFAIRLENAGLPRGPVTRLTRLFEAVRYGARASQQSDVDEAVQCLTSILEYCGEAQ